MAYTASLCELERDPSSSRETQLHCTVQNLGSGHLVPTAQLVKCLTAQL